jgi:murein DD-endopeptidase MepM/ murein hydrolase activator NlpD
MAILSLGKASKSLYTTRKKTSLASNTIKSISNILTDRSLKRKNLTTNILNYKNKRIQREKREKIQEAIRAPIQITKFRGPTSLSLAQTGKSFTERILGFVGFISAGWLLSNMPTWTAAGNQLIDRIRTISPILSGFTDSIGQLMTDIGSLTNGFYQNMKIFDFSDSNNLVRGAMSDLSLTLQTMGDKITEAFDVLTAPFIGVPPLGSKGEPGAYPDTTPPPQIPQSPPPSSGSGPSGTTYGVNLKALADATSSAEGTYNEIGPFTYYPMGHGLGRYQFMVGREDVQAIILKNAGNDRAKALQLIERAKSGDKKAARELLNKYFKPSDQDSLFSQHATNTLTQIKRKYPNAGEEFLVQKFGVYHLTGGDYPNSRDTLGTSGKSHGDKILSAYKRLKGKSSPSQPQITSSPSNILGTFTSPSQQIIDFFTGKKPSAIPAGQRSLVKGDVFTKSLGKGVDYVEIGDLYGSRGGAHRGIDILIPHGTYIALRTECEVVVQGEYGNYGLLMDVWVPSYGVQLRMAHLSSVLIKSGKIPAGTSFARVGSSGNASGPHIHFEYDTVKGESRGGGAGNPEAYVRLLLLTKSPNKSQFSAPPSSIPGKPSIPSTPLTPQLPSTSIQTPGGEVQIESNSPSVLDEFLIQITPERKGRQIIFINDVKSSGEKVVMSAGGSQTISVNETDMVNNFIKNKLLLDLNYL